MKRPIFYERPNIIATTTTTGPYTGYMVRSRCMVDGFPAEVRIRVNTQRPDLGEFDIRVFDPIKLEWVVVYEIEPDEVGHFPSPIGDDPGTLAALNLIATSMWEIATDTMSIARERQLAVDAATKAAARYAIDHAASAAQWVMPEENVALRHGDGATP